MVTYCEFSRGNAIHAPYHDREYGFPIDDDNELFERLVLEINQAGLSWQIILKKREGFRDAYARFDVDTVAAFDDAARARLLDDPGIVRNRLKVNAAIENARKIIELRGQFGSFAGWLAAHHPRDKADWVRLFKQTFKFTGGEIVGEFLKSIGYLEGAHEENCPAYGKIMTRNPPWAAVRARKGAR